MTEHFVKTEKPGNPVRTGKATGPGRSRVLQQRAAPSLLGSAAIILFFMGFACLLGLRAAGLGDRSAGPAAPAFLTALAGFAGGLVYFGLVEAFGFKSLRKEGFRIPATPASMALFAVWLVILCISSFCFVLSLGAGFGPVFMRILLAGGIAAVAATAYGRVFRSLVSFLLPDDFAVYTAPADAGYPIVPMEDFVSETEVLAAQAGRHNLGIGMIAIDISNLLAHAAGDHRARTFLRKQIIFLLTENARRYEPWTRNPEKDIYLNSLLLNDESELVLAEKRFLEILHRHEFTVYDTRLPPVRFPSTTVYTANADLGTRRPSAETAAALIAGLASGRGG